MQQPSTTNPVLILPLRANDCAVGGLIWQPLTSLKNLKQETKQLVKKEQCDYFIVHQQSKKAQCGLMKSLPNSKRYYSLALLLIDKLGSDWLGIFEVSENRYFLLGIEGGQVVPGCDALFSSAESVLEHFENYRALFNWQTIYAPAALSLGGESLTIESLLKGTTPKANRRLLYTRELNQQSKRFGLRIAILVVLAIAAIIGWQHYQQKKEEAARQARLRELQAQQAKKALVVQEVWRQQAPAAELVRDCVQAITRYPISIGGWQAVGFLCDAKSAKAVYQRRPMSTVKKFLAALPEVYQEHYQFLKNGDSAQINQPIRIDNQRQQEQLQPLFTLAQDILRKIQQGVATGRVDDVLSGNKRSANFELISQTSPLLLLQDLNLDGVVINHLTATLSLEGLLTWKIAGVIYGQ
ncbi:type 4b pilus protein PilO2 [unidentified bacterial endosymbiont]|uniref:type 4b pilus protein PilO2 n=1 Tax=unidentified bacterial endosymbiont TaxID=2355 RepID=UPI00209F1CEC|nr:type 4b pilus protein PilO2 [unidentified bacterial endosymbiont]